MPVGYVGAFLSKKVDKIVGASNVRLLCIAKYASVEGVKMARWNEGALAWRDRATIIVYEMAMISVGILQPFSSPAMRLERKMLYCALWQMLVCGGEILLFQNVEARPEKYMKQMCGALLHLAAFLIAERRPAGAWPMKSEIAYYPMKVSAITATMAYGAAMARAR